MPLDVNHVGGPPAGSVPIVDHAPTGSTANTEQTPGANRNVDSGKHATKTFRQAIDAQNKAAIAEAVEDYMQGRTPAYAEPMRQINEKMRGLTKELVELGEQLPRNNRIGSNNAVWPPGENNNSSPGKKTVMSRSISRAFPAIATVAFVAGGLMLLTGGLFGFMMGAVLAYGAFSLYKAVKNEQEADIAQKMNHRNAGQAEHPQRANMDEDEDEDDAHGKSNAISSNRPPHPMAAGAWVGPAESKSDEAEESDVDTEPSGVRQPIYSTHPNLHRANVEPPGAGNPPPAHHLEAENATANEAAAAPETAAAAATATAATAATAAAAAATSANNASRRVSASDDGSVPAHSATAVT